MFWNTFQTSQHCRFWQCISGFDWKCRCDPHDGNYMRSKLSVKLHNPIHNRFYIIICAAVYVHAPVLRNWRVNSITYTSLVGIMAMGARKQLLRLFLSYPYSHLRFTNWNDKNNYELIDKKFFLWTSQLYVFQKCTCRPVGLMGNADLTHTMWVIWGLE